MGRMELLIFPDGTRHCARANGSRLRAWFTSKAEAEAFAADPANHPVYLGDVAHLCPVCEFWHLSRPEWLKPPAKIDSHEDGWDAILKARAHTIASGNAPLVWRQRTPNPDEIDRLHYLLTNKLGDV